MAIFNFRDNFVIIYELLDEMMDNGYPQNTDVDYFVTFSTRSSMNSSNQTIIN